MAKGETGSRGERRSPTRISRGRGESSSLSKGEISLKNTKGKRGGNFDDVR